MSYLLANMKLCLWWCHSDYRVCTSRSKWYPPAYKCGRHTPWLAD